MYVCTYDGFHLTSTGFGKFAGSTGRADVGPYIVIRSLHAGIAIFVRIVVYTPPGAENPFRRQLWRFPPRLFVFFPGTLFSRVRPVISSPENERQIMADD